MMGDGKGYTLQWRSLRLPHCLAKNCTLVATVESCQFLLSSQYLAASGGLSRQCAQVRSHTHKVVTHSTHAFHVKQSVCLFAFLGKNNNIKIYMPFRTLANMPVINTNTMGIQKKNILITMFIVKLDVSNL